MQLADVGAIGVAGLLAVDAGVAMMGGAEGIPYVSGALAFAGPTFTMWYAYYTTTTVIPRINSEHREEREKLAEEHRQDTARLADVFAEKIAKAVRDELKLLLLEQRADAAQKVKQES